jgi:integrase
MAWGRVFKKGKYYYTDIKYQGQRRRKKVGKNLRLAERVLGQKLADLILTEHGILDNQKITLKQFAPEYLLHKKQGMRPKSYHRVEGIIKVHLIPILGKLFLFEITPEKLFTYQSKRLAKGVSNATVNREAGVLKNLLNVAVEWRRLKTNPIRATKKLMEPPGRLRFLSLEEIHKLLGNCPPPPHPLRDMVMVALTTGMRRGEILGLKWDYVRLESRFIILPITKNNTVRVLPINDTLHRLLSEIPQKRQCMFSGTGTGGTSGTLSTASLRLAGMRASLILGFTTYATPTLRIWR